MYVYIKFFCVIKHLFTQNYTIRRSNDPFFSRHADICHIIVFIYLNMYYVYFHIYYIYVILRQQDASYWLRIHHIFIFIFIVCRSFLTTKHVYLSFQNFETSRARNKKLCWTILHVWQEGSKEVSVNVSEVVIGFPRQHGGKSRLPAVIVTFCRHFWRQTAAVTAGNWPKKRW